MLGTGVHFTFIERCGGVLCRAVYTKIYMEYRAMLKHTLVPVGQLFIIRN